MNFYEFTLTTGGTLVSVNLSHVDSIATVDANNTNLVIGADTLEVAMPYVNVKKLVGM